MSFLSPNQQCQSIEGKYTSLDLHKFHLSAYVRLYISLFRLDALALSIIATGTWLAGWLGGWLSVTAGIVSKRLNLSKNFFDHLIAPS